MQFIDTNVIVYAYFEPKTPKAETKTRRESAQKIMDAIGNNAIQAATSVVHLSEAANILVKAGSPKSVSSLLRAIMAKVKVLPVAAEDYIAAAEESIENNIGINDCLAVVLMENHGITEIYSSDSDFDTFPGIKRIWQ